MCVPFSGAPDRAIPGRSFPHRSKHHLLVDATGIPLAVALTGGNRNDVTNSSRCWTTCIGGDMSALKTTTDEPAVRGLPIAHDQARALLGQVMGLVRGAQLTSACAAATGPLRSLATSASTPGNNSRQR
jgi:hypothetical protein